MILHNQVYHSLFHINKIDYLPECILEIYKHDKDVHIIDDFLQSLYVLTSTDHQIDMMLQQFIVSSNWFWTWFLMMMPSISICVKSMRFIEYFFSFSFSYDQVSNLFQWWRSSSPNCPLWFITESSSRRSHNCLSIHKRRKYFYWTLLYVIDLIPKIESYLKEQDHFLSDILLQLYIFIIKYSDPEQFGIVLLFLIISKIICYRFMFNSFKCISNKNKSLFVIHYWCILNSLITIVLDC